MKVLFIGDIVGNPGRRALAGLLPRAKTEWGPFDFVVANVENAAGGFGLTEKVDAYIEEKRVVVDHRRTASSDVA